MRRERSTWIAAAAALSFAIFCAKGLAYLYTRHPHEDAFILFRYAEHVAHGQGIVFNADGPRAEGATDFLYMLLLALLVRVGFDVAIAALCLNACGAALIAALLCKLWPRAQRLPAPVALLAGSLVPLLAGAQASYDGFGTELYCGLGLLGFYSHLTATTRSLLALPYLALILGLFRPDGVIIGAAFCVLALHEVWAPRELRSRFILHSAIAVVGGACYFVWRFHYFGQLLPLPLYVKARGTSALPGLSDNATWFADPAGPGAPLLIGVGLCLALSRRGISRWRRIVYGTAPAWLVLLCLCFANQLQNVDWRFQAPSLTVFIAALCALSAELLAALTRARDRWLVYAVCLGALVPAIARGKKLWPRTYVDTFAVDFGRILSRPQVVLTEAGRLAYWSDASVEDLVGLNSARSARVPPSVAYVASLEPDIVMFHVAGTVDMRQLVDDEDARGSLAPISAQDLPAAVRAPFRRYLDPPSAYGASDVPTKLAPVVLGAFLAGRDDFDVFAVRYGSDFNHVIAIKRGKPFTEPVEAALRRAQLPASYSAYAASKGFCFSARVRDESAR